MCTYNLWHICYCCIIVVIRYSIVQYEKKMILVVDRYIFTHVDIIDRQ